MKLCVHTERNLANSYRKVVVKYLLFSTTVSSSYGVDDIVVVTTSLIVLLQSPFASTSHAIRRICKRMYFICIDPIKLRIRHFRQQKTTTGQTIVDERKKKKKDKNSTAWLTKLKWHTILSFFYSRCLFVLCEWLLAKWFASSALELIWMSLFCVQNCEQNVHSGKEAKKRSHRSNGAQKVMAK